MIWRIAMTGIRLCVLILICINPLTAQKQKIAETSIPSETAMLQELRQSVERWRIAYNANDLTSLGSFYSDDILYVSPHVPNLIISGRETLTKNFARGISGGGHIDSVAVVTADLSGDMAYLVTTYFATNSGVGVTGKNIIIMKRINGVWLIVTHASII